MSTDMGYETRTIFTDDPGVTSVTNHFTFHLPHLERKHLRGNADAGLDRLLADLYPAPKPRTPLLPNLAAFACNVLMAVIVAIGAGMMLVLLAALAPLVAIACVFEWRRNRAAARVAWRGITGAAFERAHEEERDQ